MLTPKEKFCSSLSGSCLPQRCRADTDHRLCHRDGGQAEDSSGLILPDTPLIDFFSSDVHILV